MSSSKAFQEPAISIDAALVEYERLWLQGRCPSLETFLVRCPAESRAELLIELIHIDLEFRLKQGQAARVEDYLVRFPELAHRPHDLISLLRWEYCQRRRQEPDLDRAAYQKRFPPHSACGYALSVSLVDKDGDKERYATRAVALLRLAVEKGYKDFEHLKKDTDLDVLRQRDDFRKLVEKLERM